MGGFWSIYHGMLIDGVSGWGNVSFCPEGGKNGLLIGGGFPNYELCLYDDGPLFCPSSSLREGDLVGFLVVSRSGRFQKLTYVCVF